ncbi:unnamed protein product [Rhizoctonia solani]|uniref:Peptidase C14 caspase domain-containing protein n=1 Tax=Rhizoctonia solani TaxID=456999 RepID=A0A8H3CG66_9AGAM|nr:unnamed protein product [Rhizoctonia solani]
MILPGATTDHVHFHKFLENFKFTPGVRVMPIGNALRKDIVGDFVSLTLEWFLIGLVVMQEDQIEKAVGDCPPLLVVYFQGHGIHTPDWSTVKYITGDHREDGALEGVAAEELITMFSKLTALTLTVALTDFCHAGNVFRLRFRLCIAQDGTGFWAESDEWYKDTKAGQKQRITSPMLHVAASLRHQQVYETKKRGGYFTNGLAHSEAGDMTLTRFLLGLRRCVDDHLKDAKTHESGPLPKNAMQAPQIFCTGTPPLDDPEIFAKIRDGATDLC